MARYALVTGINRYDNFRNLDKAATDAAAIARILQSHGQYQVEPLPKRLIEAENRWELATDKKLTAKDLGQSLETFLLERAKDQEALIYFAGHGFEVLGLGRKQKGYLATSDSTNDGRNAILFSDLNDLIRESNLSSLVLILDCCHAGSFLERTMLESTLTAFREKKDYYLITACRSFERAREGEEHGVFTEAVLKGLESENADSEGNVTGDRLFDFVRQELRQSGQEPIRAGIGRALILVNYPIQGKNETGIDESIVPYPGLVPFEKEQADFFFGRKQVVEDIWRSLADGNFVAVIGTSGSGKSSAVRAGLVPWLESRGWQTKIIKPGVSPLGRLQATFEPLFVDSRSQKQLFDFINTSPSGLRQLAEQLPGCENYLLVVDQFEEVFTLSRAKEKQKFIEFLTQAAQDPHPRLAVVTTMRADFIDQCLQDSSLTRLIQHQAIFMPPLVGADLEQAIVEPAKRLGYSFESGLLGEILQDVGQESGFLPLLQFALLELWEKRDRQKRLLTQSAYHDMGRLLGALDRHAEKTYENLSNSQKQDWTKRLFLKLVRTGSEMKDTRQRQLKQKLMELSLGKDSQNIIEELIQDLVDSRLLVTGEESGEIWVDLAHEALMESWEKFKTWRQEDRELRRLADRVEDAQEKWQKHQESPDYFLDAKLFGEVQQKMDDLIPYVGLNTQDFYQKSKNWYDNLPGITLIENLKRDFLDNLFRQGTPSSLATQHDYYMALAYLVRYRMLHRWNGTAEAHTQHRARTVCYLSVEFLMGPHLGNNLINMRIYEQVKQAMEELGLDFDNLLAQEEEPGLGNGGLGRLAACYLDSLASLEIPSMGYGIRYEFGIFVQGLRDGWQVERTDKWLRYGNPWEIPRPELSVEVKFGGHTETYVDNQERYQVRWVPDKVVRGVPHDTPILGYQVNTCNTLRLWSSEAFQSFDFTAFNAGDYSGAVDEKMESENISKVLYPNEKSHQGKQLRLEQKYFFVSCSLQDMIRTMRRQNLALEQFHEHYAIQLNDTDPTIAIAELMRLLLDEYGFDWDKAWNITTKTFAYTNHTLLTEALECLPLEMFGRLLPRHLELIDKINQCFLEEVRINFPDDMNRLSRMSLIDESGERYVRMANLACVGSFAINGVAELHSELLKQTVLHDFYEMFPEKFTNVTNGVTPRRFIVLSNPRLANLITNKIGDGWIKHLDDLRELETFVDDPDFCQEFRQVKRDVKQDLTNYIRSRYGIKVDPKSLFDIQLKRIHEYKRQQLSALYIITLYNRIKANPDIDIIPRTFLFGGKAAPDYSMAKLIIKLINSIADIVNFDPDMRGRLRVVFLENFNVKLGQLIYPAADLSEQISVANSESSGTGNMKFAMNGALTIGTLNGANIEIREAVGTENFFLFGLTMEEVQNLKTNRYNPRDYYNSNPELKLAIDLIASGFFSHGNPDLFEPLLDSLLNRDEYLLFADYQSYIDCQDRVGQAYGDPEQWTRMSILNTARMGKFSSDRAIQEYCQNIWRVAPFIMELTELNYSGSWAGKVHLN